MEFDDYIYELSEEITQWELYKIGCMAVLNIFENECNDIDQDYLGFIKLARSYWFDQSISNEDITACRVACICLHEYKEEMNSTSNRDLEFGYLLHLGQKEKLLCLV